MTSRRVLSVVEKRWPMREPFAISRGVQTDQPCIIVELRCEDGVTGWGEGCGVMYAGETPQTMIADVEGVRDAVEAGADRKALLDLLPAGGARCALDAALWDIEARSSGQSVYEALGVGPPSPVTTACTIGIRSIAAYEEAARGLSAYKLLKVKVDGADPLAAIAAVHRGAPGAQFIIDPNQSWSVDDIIRWAPQLADMNVALLEQPIPVGDEGDLDGVTLPIKICADELIDTVDELDKAEGRYDVINIKLDKTGGLTAAWDLADAAEERGFELMVGCMAGSSLSMAPAHVLAQRCAFVDLDGPLLQSEDWPNGMKYADGVLDPPPPGFWG